MAKRVCVRCQTPVVLGADFCANCGAALSNLAQNHPQFRMARFAMIGGTRRKPGEMPTFAKLHWLPFALAIVMFLATLEAIPGMPGAIAAPLMALIAFAVCLYMQAQTRAMVRREREE